MLSLREEIEALKRLDVFYNAAITDALAVLDKHEAQCEHTNDFLFMLPDGTIGMRRTAYLYRRGIEHRDEEANRSMGDGDIILGRPKGLKDRQDAARIIAYLGGLEPEPYKEPDDHEDRPSRGMLERLVGENVPYAGYASAIVEAIDALAERLDRA